jgi:hypothetical protein
MAEFTKDELAQNEFVQPTESDKEIVEFVVSHCDRWRDWRDTNYLEDWREYERIFRGKWAAEDRTRESERSRIISPATQQAVETRHAEICEAIFGNGEWFDIRDDLVDQQLIDVELLKLQLKEDLEKENIRKAITQVELLAEIYGTGIGELTVSKKTELFPQTMPMVDGTAAYGVMEKEYTCVKLNPINPKNFLIDPNAVTVDEAMGVAIESYVSIHQVVAGIEKGIYRKVDIQPYGQDDDLEPTQEDVQFRDDKVLLMKYYGLVPREYIEQLENEEGEEVVDLFPEDSTADKYSDLVEAIVVIANGSTLLKAEKTPYMMKDRPVVAYQDDTVPNRFWGRGTVEKAYNMQKGIDAQLRSHLDSLALTTSPMIAMDATRLPRGAKFEVKPGKAILTNGNPAEILFPFKFGTTDQGNLAISQNFERMLLQATGTVDAAGQPTQFTRDGAAQFSMSIAGIVKKYKRTLTNFQEDFLVPLIRKAAYRFMQFDPERYPAADYKFIPMATLGIIAREYEQQQLIALLQTLGPDTPVLPMILKGIIASSSLPNRAEMITQLEQMMQPNPEQQQLAQAQLQLQLQAQQAQIKQLDASATRDMAEAQKTMVEAQLAPREVEAKVVSAVSRNLPSEDDAANQEFDRRVKIAELMLKEADIKNKSKIVELQMSEKMNTIGKTEEDFLNKITEKLSNNG